MYVPAPMFSRIIIVHGRRLFVSSQRGGGVEKERETHTHRKRMSYTLRENKEESESARVRTWTCRTN